MQRRLLVALCACAITATSFRPAMATISLSLNLRYTYPGDESLGGTWDLMARDNSAFGISALVVVLDNINFGSTTLNSGIGAIPIETQQSGTITEFVYVQDPNGVAGVSKFANVGKGSGTPGNVAKDDLYPIFANSYDNMARIASGTFGAVRPSFATFPGVGGGPTEGAVWNDAAMTVASSTVPAMVLLGGDGVRGDSTTHFDDTMLNGDSNRDGTVDSDDLFKVLNNFFGPVASWDLGDVANNDGLADSDDLLDILNNFFASAPNPAVVTVPEPGSIGLVALACMMFGVVCRRAGQ